MHTIIRSAGWLREHWGTMSQLILGLVALLLAMFPSTILDLEKKPKYRVGVPLLVGIIAITGYVASESTQGNLENQLRTLYQQVRLEASKDDVATLTRHIDDGFKSVVDAIVSLCKSTKTAVPQHVPEAIVPPSLPLPPNVSITQARAVSTDPQLRYALQVTIQSDQQITASFAIECTGEVGKVDAFMVGVGAYMDVRLGAAKNIAIVHYGYPPLNPQTPLIVTILSKEDIRVKGVKPL